MKKYKVLVAVQATLTKEVTIKADSKKEAMMLAEEVARVSIEAGTWSPQAVTIDIDTLTVE